MDVIGRIAGWAVWAALAVVVAMVLYQETGWFKPATAKAADGARSALARVPFGMYTRNTASEKLASARDEYAHGDSERAITLYNQYIDDKSKDPDARGELGNLYMMTGRLAEAAQAYSDAARLLLDKGEFDRVGALLPVIARANPKRAEEIAQRLREATGAWTMAPRSSEGYRRAPQSALTRH